MFNKIEAVRQAKKVFSLWEKAYLKILRFKLGVKNLQILKWRFSV